MEKLRQVLKQSDTVLFIGSGISTWSGIPSWTEAVEELAQFLKAAGVNPDLVRAEAEKGELIQAASYGLDRMTKPQIGEFIRSLCRCGSARPEEIHRKIVNLGPRYYITTNYDNLIEQSLRKWHEGRAFSNGNEQAPHGDRRDRPYVCQRLRVQAAWRRRAMWTASSCRGSSIGRFYLRGTDMRRWKR